ncbi:Flp pilus assembly protein CpaB [Methylonatrum kenyense]|uniref:Flp pilus assembly protein CpaB n=1 Tax=Methylonatrum kenyense TaxID=455253 RepID=UPI0020BF8230|nr:Flp pilus assembly protein CpaB [Methylonatrum kenyense]MCK8515213.1 Flp pilus assembly protein CpaB [Methylonatrum kenyense]
MSSRVITALAVLLGTGAIVLIVLGLRLQNDTGIDVVEREPVPVEEAPETDEPEDVEEEPELVEDPSEPEPVAREVVVLARDLTAGTRLLLDDLELKHMDDAPETAIGGRDQGVDHRLREDLEAGDVITTDLLRAPDALADRLRPGQRAFAVPVDELAAVGGLLKPGDHVDVLAHLEDESEDASRVLVEYAAVLSFGPSLERNDDGEREQDTGSRTAVLALEREAVPVLLMAQQHGRLSLALTGQPEDDVVVGGLTEEALFARPSEYSRPGGEPTPEARNQAPTRSPVSIHRGTSRQEVER